MERLKDLVSRSDLESINVHELSAKLVPGVSEESDEATFDLNIQTRAAPGEFGVRVTVDATTPVGVIKVVIAAEYSAEGAEPDPELLGLFASEVAIMSVFPYVRQAVSDMSQRVFEQPLMMPIVKRGELQLTPIDADSGD